MNLKSKVAPGLVKNEVDPNGGFISSIDATAGGFGADPPSYVYARFTEAGLEKVEISDEQALEQMDWDIGFRRFIMRVNSGNSGPSCVSATLAGKIEKTEFMPLAYDDVKSLPPGLTFISDSYLDAECKIIGDGSGLDGSPGNALKPFWDYKMCVKMTDTAFILGLADGRTLKFVVESYYKPEVQEQCNNTDTLPAGATGSGNVVVRWAFLP